MASKRCLVLFSVLLSANYGSRPDTILKNTVNNQRSLDVSVEPLFGAFEPHPAVMLNGKSRTN